MKKTFFWFIVVSFMFIPAYSYAQNVTVADLQAQIASLLAQIEGLKAQLGGISNPSSPAPFCHSFGKNLRIGDRGEDVRALQRELREQGFEVNDSEGVFGESTASAVVGFQEKFRGEVLTPHGLSRGTGYVGVTTRAKLNLVFKCGTQTGSVEPKSMPGIQPVPLSVSCNGTPYTASRADQWGYITWTAYPIGGSDYRYQWSMYNDGVVADGSLKSITAKYPLVGTKEAVVRVTSGGKTVSSSCKAVISMIPKEDSLTVISPNGGEAWQKGTTQTIKWQDGRSFPTCTTNSTGTSPTCINSAPRMYDISLVPFVPPCTEVACITYSPSPYVVAKNVMSTSYQWKVGNIADLYDELVSDGAYSVRVCQSGTNTCDSSDSYFKIYSGNSSNRPPVISGVDAPTTLSTGQVGTWTIRAYDPDGTSLSYSVWWGDEVYAHSGNLSSSVASQFTQSATFTHSYATAGTYTPQFTVRDGSGQTTQVNISVRVGDVSPSPSITVLSPNGGESYSVGQRVSVKWKTTGLVANADTLLAIYDDRIPNWQTRSFFGSSPVLNYAQLISSDGTGNTYEYLFTVPENFNSSLPSQYQNIFGGNHYKIGVIALVGGIAGTASQRVVEDYSNNSFTITSASTLPDKVSAEVRNYFDDRAGSWGVFGPGSGTYQYSFDWNWEMQLSPGSAKTIKSIGVYHTSSGAPAHKEGWSTATVDDYGRNSFPLVVTRNGTQQNYQYDGTLGTYFSATTFKLYGQVESTSWKGGEVIVNFTDGTQAKGLIPASSYVPPVPPTATLTIGGQETYSYNVGQYDDWKWSSTNADTFSSTYVANDPLKCGDGVWVANTAQGSVSTYIGAQWEGCVWKVAYTVKNSTTGMSASDSATLMVNPFTTTTNY